MATAAQLTCGDLLSNSNSNLWEPWVFQNYLLTYFQSQTHKTVQTLSEAWHTQFLNKHFIRKLRSQILTDLVGRCTIKSIYSSWACKPPVVRAKEIGCQYTYTTLWTEWAKVESELSEKEAKCQGQATLKFKYFSISTRYLDAFWNIEIYCLMAFILSAMNVQEKWLLSFLLLNLF